MRRFVLAATAALALLGPGRAAALQRHIDVGARIGTLGLGADVAVGLTDRIAIRGGAGFLGFDLDVTPWSDLASNRTAELSLPDALYTLGAEYSFGRVRAEAGVLVRSGDPVYTITYRSGATIDIGGGFYAEPDVRTLTTTHASRSSAPYALLGFAPELSSRLRLEVDLGAVFPLDAGFEMSATGDPTVLGSRRFFDDLETERLDAEADAGALLHVWPMFSIGLRYRVR